MFEVFRKPILLGAMVVMMVACASSTPPVRELDPKYVDGVRQTPRTYEEVQKALSRNRTRFLRCFQNEALNSTQVSAFVFRMEVFASGDPPIPTILNRTVKGQEMLEQCLIEKLHQIEFEPCAGETMMVDVSLSMDELLGRAHPTNSTPSADE